MPTSLSDRMKGLHGMSDAEYEDMQQKEAAMARAKSMRAESEAEYAQRMIEEAPLRAAYKPTPDDYRRMQGVKVFPDFDTKLAEAPKPKISRWQRFAQWCKG